MTTKVAAAASANNAMAIRAHEPLPALEPPLDPELEL